ncbi:PAS domain S-box-containing protein [Eubacterium uniforme]|uniref:PAS domain S-box-containing protein n=1 Tax=Eubacterium uniforme TaxID=39495 RepID=A0A1T4VYC8_9FIRM|nr:HD domain-containing phosphohydrolase [Eubacterium uniforme]SKA70014.1 PAS domain S-box-containing protein [Eubacterium uniforme]
MDKKKRDLFFENIVTNISDGLIAIDLDGTIFFVNPSAERILAIPSVILLGTKVSSLMVDESSENDEFFQCILDAVYEKKPVDSMVSFYQNGRELRLHLVASVLMEKEEPMGIVVTFYDLTALVSMNEKNARLNRALSESLDRFIQVMIGAIEARTPYNANHTRSMVMYAKKYLDWLEANGDRRVRSIRKPFIASVWLHDIGKLVIPKSIMDKARRLGSHEKDVMHRIELAIMCERLRMANDPSTKRSANRRIKQLEDAGEIIMAANIVGYLNDEMSAKIEKISKMNVLTPTGEKVKLLDKYEKDSLLIRRGTLTDEERMVIQSHVIHTKEMLDQMDFSEVYGEVSTWASNHHEFLDGSGYPQGLKGDQISWECRLLTIIDIYDSITADDRPYKPAMPPERAFDVLRSMCREGKLDLEVTESFYESMAWDREQNEYFDDVVFQEVKDDED